MALPIVVDGLEVTVSGTIRRIASLRAEFYEYVGNPSTFLPHLRDSGLRADVFTFLQETAERRPRFDFQIEPESIAALHIKNFDTWWKNQLNDKTRNMIRKAQKAGVQVSVVPYDDKLIEGIVGIYNENPMRQGKPFAHYGKGFETIKKDHVSYVESSDFIAAYHREELIGFAKLVHRPGVSSLMQIISKISHRHKAPESGRDLCRARRAVSALWPVEQARAGRLQKAPRFRAVRRGSLCCPADSVGSTAPGHAAASQAVGVFSGTLGKLPRQPPWPMECVPTRQAGPVTRV
jgi:hypothetical protein